MIFALVALVLDQASKYAVIFGLGTISGTPYPILPPLLVFGYGENRGINFGLFAGGIPVWVLVALALGICAALVVWMRRSPQKPIAHISAGLVIGGAIGNVIDRLIYGYVLDFLNMSCCGIRNPYVFNVADIFVFAGAFGLVIWADDGKAKQKGT